MLASNQFEYGIRGAIPEEDFPLAENDVLLQVHCHQFTGTEVLHSLRDLESGLFAKLEVGIDGGTRREHHSCVVSKVNSLRPEFFRCQRLYLEKRIEVDFNPVFLFQCGICG